VLHAHTLLAFCRRQLFEDTRVCVQSQLPFCVYISFDCQDRPPFQVDLSSSNWPEVKQMPESRNTQHSQQRQFFGSQRQRRNAQAPPHCCQTREGLSNLQSFLVNTAPCFPAGNQVTPQTKQKVYCCRQLLSPAQASVCSAFSACHSVLRHMFASTGFQTGRLLQC